MGRKEHPRTPHRIEGARPYDLELTLTEVGYLVDVVPPAVDDVRWFEVSVTLRLNSKLIFNIQYNAPHLQNVQNLLEVVDVEYDFILSVGDLMLVPVLYDLLEVHLPQFLEDYDLVGVYH